MKRVASDTRPRDVWPLETGALGDMGSERHSRRKNMKQEAWLDFSEGICLLAFSKMKPKGKSP